MQSKSFIDNYFLELSNAKEAINKKNETFI